MKKLLYVAVIAALFTSCNVEDLQDETSIDFDKITAKAPTKNSVLCSSKSLINANLERRGRLMVYVDHTAETFTISLLTYENWKIRDSRLLFGYPDTGADSLFELDKFGFDESFDQGIYYTNYTFLLSDVKDTYALKAMLYITDDFNNTENVWSLQGDGIPEGTEPEFYILEFLRGCM